MRWFSINLSAKRPSLSPEALKVLYGRSPGLLSFPCLPTPMIGTVARGLENHLQLTVAGTAPDLARLSGIHRIPF